MRWYWKVWRFDKIQITNPRAKKRYSRPSHVQWWFSGQKEQEACECECDASESNEVDISENANCDIFSIGDKSTSYSEKEEKPGEESKCQKKSCREFYPIRIYNRIVIYLTITLQTRTSTMKIWAKDGPQVARIFQASVGKNGKQ